MGIIIFVIPNLFTILKLTLVEQGDHLRKCVSTCVLHLCPLVVVVIKGVANTHHLAENPTKQSPLRDVSTGEETDAKAILPIPHPVNNVGRLLAVAFSKSVGDKDLFPAETNYHVLLQNLLAAAAVHLTAAATRRERLCVFCALAERLCVFCALTGFVFCNNNATRMRQNSLSDEPPTNWVSAESS